MSDVMSGIRILEVAEHTFVPAASAILADWGADVIKIEHAVRGDAMRGLGASGSVAFDQDVPVLVEHANRGKRSLGLDLADPDGLAILYRLAQTADVFLTNKLPSVCERLHIRVDDLRVHNPSIVYVRGTGYGTRGPDANAGGYDFLGFWARGGSAAASRAPGSDDVPFQPAPAYGDTIGAMTIAGGICAALLHRERTGEAKVVDVSLLATGMWAMAGAIALSQLTGEPWYFQPPTGTGTPSNPAAGIYRTADDRFLAFSMLQGFHYWPELCERIRRPELVNDPRFATAELLAANAPEAAKQVADAIGAQPLQYWMERLAGMKGQWSAVQDTIQVANDPQTIANGYLQDLETDDGLPYRVVSTPVQFDEQPARARRGPTFNEHGDALLTDELGIDWDTVIDLKVRGVVA
jgi:crotonobetainyl-CoA:carnitine CoA-transferase CaiB-like acyl-CoA transferase